MKRTTKKFMYPHKVAELLSIDPRQVARLVNDGELDAIRIGKRGYRIDAESYENFLERQRIERGYLDK